MNGPESVLQSKPIGVLGGGNRPNVTKFQAATLSLLVMFLLILATFATVTTSLGPENKLGMARSVARELSSSQHESSDLPSERSAMSQSVGTVLETLSILNGTVLPGNAVLSQPLYPVGIAYDPFTGCLLVTGSGANDVAEVNVSNGNIVAVASTGPGPQGVAIDQGNGLAYVANTASNTLTVLNATTLVYVATVPVGASPIGIAIDNLSGNVYVSNTDSDNLTVINGTTDNVSGSIQVGGSPQGIGFNQVNGLLYVANSVTDTVSVIDPAKGTVARTLGAGIAPTAIGVDDLTGDVAIVNEMSGNMSIIDLSYKTLAQVQLGQGSYPWAVSIDPSSSEAYVVQQNNDTVSIVNMTSYKVIAVLGVGGSPEGVTFDPLAEAAVVTNPYTQNISIIDVGSTVVSSSITLATGPTETAYDQANGKIYVDDALLDTINVYNATSLSWVSNITAGPPEDSIIGPSASSLALDPALKGLYIANEFTSNLSLVNVSTDSVSKVTSLGSGGPSGIALDEENGNLYVPNIESGNLTVVRASDDTTIGSIRVGDAPTGVAIDSANGDIYVSNNQSNNLSVISSSTGKVVGAIPTGTGPDGVAFDPLLDRVYASNYGSANLSIFNGQTGKAVGSPRTGLGPFGVSLDPVTGDLYVSNSLSGNITVISGESGAEIGSVRVGSGPVSAVYDADIGAMLVSNFISGTLTVLKPASGAALYGSEFVPNLLPGGTPWAVTIGNLTEGAMSGSLSFVEPNGTYHFSVTVTGPYIPAPQSGNISIAGKASETVITFSLRPKASYLLTFTESGLPAGSLWSVTLSTEYSTSTATTIGFNITNGTYTYSIGSPKNYIARQVSGIIVISGADRMVGVSFRSTLPPAVPLYSVVFYQVGLNGNTNWSIDLMGDTLTTKADSLSFIEQNGTYSFTANSAGLLASPSNGSITVNGGNASIAIGFTPFPQEPTYDTLIVYALLATVAALAAIMLGILLFRRPRFESSDDEEEVPPEEPEVGEGELTQEAQDSVVIPEMVEPSGPVDQQEAVEQSLLPEAYGQYMQPETDAIPPESDWQQPIDYQMQPDDSQPDQDLSYDADSPPPPVRLCFNCGSELHDNFCPICNMIIPWEDGNSSDQ